MLVTGPCSVGGGGFLRGGGGGKLAALFPRRDDHIDVPALALLAPALASALAFLGALRFDALRLFLRFLLLLRLGRFFLFLFRQPVFRGGVRGGERVQPALQSLVDFVLQYGVPVELDRELRPTLKPFRDLSPLVAVCGVRDDQAPLLLT